MGAYLGQWIGEELLVVDLGAHAGNDDNGAFLEAAINPGLR